MEQEIFDKVVKHLRAQNKKAYDEIGRVCVYLAADGLKCAAGCLIPDGHPAAQIRHAWPMIPGDQFTPPYLVEIADQIGHHQLVRNLQRIHDDLEPNDWEDALDSLARCYELTMPNL